MAESVSPRKYLYWSKRRIDKIVEDNGIDLSRGSTRKFRTPTMPFAPQYEYEIKSKVPGREQIAAGIERYLAGVTVSDFVNPPSVRFARGIGHVVFSEVTDWQAHDYSTVGMFTETLSSTGTRVAVCMFGSRDNLADVLAAAEPSRRGWTSSARQAIVEFIQSRCTSNNSRLDERELTRDAVQMLLYQGTTSGRPGDETHQPWLRGFSFGHIDDSGEWMMEVYHDVDFSEDPLQYGSGYDRVLLGAPLWIRTPTPQALTIYDHASQKLVLDPLAKLSGSE